jgi:argininosuccinate lyase
VGALSFKLHTGRSRNDQVATDLRIYLRRRAEDIDADLNRLLITLAHLAEKALEVVLPGYTHLQPAQPILFSHYLLAYGEMFLRDRQRLREAMVRMRICPLGSGALSGTIYRIRRDELARKLGFSAATENSMDAVSDRDFVLDFLYCASVIMIHLSRLAEDLILYNSGEFGFLSVADSYATGSSLMPQKKNPDALELIRGKSGRVIGHLMALLTVLKGLPMTYNKDLQEDKEGLFDTIRTLAMCLRMMRQILDSITIHPQRMRQSAARGYLNATELADYLVAKKMPFRKAHHLVGRIVRRAIELDKDLEDLALEEYREFSDLFEKDLYQALELERAVAKKMQKGGTASPAVRRALDSFRKRIMAPASAAD